MINHEVQLTRPPAPLAPVDNQIFRRIQRCRRIGVSISVVSYEKRRRASETQANALCSDQTSGLITASEFGR